MCVVKSMTEFESHKLTERVFLIRSGQSPYWKMRFRNPTNKKYIVKSTKETNRLKAIEVAEYFIKDASIVEVTSQILPELTFEYFCHKLNNEQKLKVKNGQLTQQSQYGDERRLFRKGGIVDVMGQYDITKLTTQNINVCFDKLITTTANGSPTSSTRNQLIICIRKVFKEGVYSGVIDTIPLLPRMERSRKNTTPRPSFSFDDRNNEWKKFEGFVRDNIGKSYKTKKGKDEYSNLVLHKDFYHLISLMNASFLRPSQTEVFAIKHSDITINEDPKRLTIRVRDGKTGFRYVETMQFGVDTYNAIKDYYPEHSQDEYVLFPSYKNRQTIQVYCGRLMREILRELDMKEDEFGNNRSLYSIRHTSIQMRLVYSKGAINIYNLAKNCGTSIEMIEQFYAKMLPNSSEIARNLQSFGRNIER